MKVNNKYKIYPKGLVEYKIYVDFFATKGSKVTEIWISGA